MVKHIIQKRKNKNLTLEEFHDIQESKKIKKKEQTNKKYFIDISHRHKFKRPSDKVKEIDISIAHKIEEIKVLPHSFGKDQIGSFFFDELENQRYMERSFEFLQFYHEIIDFSQTLPLILHNLPKIVTCMLSKMSSKMLRSLILKLFPPLIRDCQSEIFQLFCQEILMKLLSLIDIKNLDILEDVFLVLAYALKYLFNKIMKEFKIFYDLYFFQFFGNKNKHIRKFAAESFSYIIKKIPKNEIKAKLEIMFDSVLELNYAEYENYFESLSELLYESIKFNHNSVSLSYKYIEIYQNFWDLIVSKYSQNLNVLMIYFKFVQAVIKKTAYDDKTESNIIKTYDLIEFVSTMTDNFNGSLPDLLTEIIIKILLFHVTYHEGRKTTPKIIDFQLESLLKIEIEHHQSIEKMVYILLGKICKYTYGSLTLNSIEKLEKILLSKLEEKHNKLFFLIGLVFDDLFDESGNKKDSEVLYDEEIEVIEKKYKINKKVYEYCVILILKDFQFKDLIDINCDNQILFRFYLFWMLHKFNNSDQMINIKNSEIFSESDLKTIEKNSISIIKTTCISESIPSKHFFYFLTLLKMIKIINFDQKFKEKLGKIFMYANELIDQYFEKNSSNQIDSVFYDFNKDDFSNIYELSSDYINFYSFDALSHKLSNLSHKNILILFKNEILKTYMNKISLNFITDYQQKLVEGSKIIHQELTNLTIFRKNLGFLRYLNDLLLHFFNQITSKNIDLATLLSGMTQRNNKFFLKYESYKGSFKALSSNLCSNYSEIRLYSLRILDLFEVFSFDDKKDNSKAGKDSIFSGECELIPMLLKIETYKVDISTEREISLFLSKIIKFAETKRMPKDYVYLLLQFLIGFSYVRYATIWASIKQAIFSLLNNYNYIIEEFLKYLFFLNYCCSEKMNENIFTSPNFASMDIQISLNLNEKTELNIQYEKIFSDDYFCENDSIDKIYVFETLHDVLVMSKSLNEKNKNKILKYIKTFLENENFPKVFNENEENIDHMKILNKLLKQSENSFDEAKIKEKKRILNRKLICFLKMLSCFETIKNTLADNYFFSTNLIFLRSNNEEIQKLSLQIISLFENHHINNFLPVLKKIQNKDSFRTELLNLNSSLQNQSFFTTDQRKDLMPVIISVLYPKIFSKKGKKVKKYLETNKATIFDVFATLNNSEMNFLFTLLLDKFQINLNVEYFEIESKEFLMKIASFPIAYWLGYLSTLQNLIKSFSVLIYPFLKTLLIIILSLMKILKLYKENETSFVQNENQKKFFKGKFKELNRNILKRFSEIYDKFQDYPEMEIITKSLIQYKKQKIEKMVTESKGNDGFLAIFVIWSERDVYKHYFIEYSYLKHYIFSMYSAKKLTQKTIELLNKIVLNLLGYSNNEDNMIIEDEEIKNEDIMIENNKEDNFYDIKSKIFDKETVKSLLANIQNFFISQKNLHKSKRKHWRPSLSLIRILLSISKIAAKDIDDQYIDNFIIMFLPLIDYKYLTKVLRIENLHSAKNQKSLIQREKNFMMSCEILKAFSTLIGIKKSTNNLTKYFNHICNLIINLQGQKFRNLLIDSIKSLDLGFLCLTNKSIEILEKLNTFDRQIHRNYNYEIVIPIILEYNTSFVSQLTLNENQLILYHLFSVLEDDELSLRGCALSGFKSFMDLVKEKWDTFQDLDRKQIKKFISMMIIPNIFLKIKKNMKSKEDYKLKSYFLLFDCVLEGYINLNEKYHKKLIINRPFEENEKLYHDLGVLLNKTDSEQDFFHLIFDMKISKKIKALNLLIKKIKDNEKLFSFESISRILLPLLNYLIFQKCLEINDPNNKMPKSSLTISNYKTLLENSIEAFGLLTRTLTWAQFQKSLKTLINMLERNENQAEKVVVKLICSLLNNLNFEMNDIVQLVNSEMKKNKEEMLKKISFFSSLTGETRVSEISEQNYDEIQKQDEILIERNIIKLNLEPINQEEKEKNSMYYFLRTKVLIPLKHHMFEAKKNRNMANEDQKIRVFLTVAIVKLIKKFPLDMFLLEFPKVITNVSNSLKSRSLEVRDNARKALVEIIKILGPHFLYNIVREMIHVLQLGYQKHVLNYTIYVLLSTIIAKENKEVIQNEINTGDLDHCLDLIIPVLLEEISGIVQEEKESEDVKDKIMEMKKSKVNECFYLLSKTINFENSIFIMINFIKTLLESEKTLSTKIINKCEETLRNILEGLTHNKSIKADHLLLFCYSLIKESLKNMQKTEDKDLMVDSLSLDYNPTKKDLLKHNKAKTYEIQQGAAQGKSIFKIISKLNKKNIFECARLFGNFGLKLLISALKQKIISVNESPDILEKMNPVLILIVSCLESNNNSMISGSLRILYFTLKWPMESIKKSYKKMMNSLLKILQNLSVNDIEMIQDSFKLLTEILGSEEARPFLTEKQIKCVIDYIENFVFSSEKTTESLECLKMLVSKKFIRAEIYTLIEKLKDVMVMSYSRNFQNLCKEIYLTFLVEFPLSEKLIEKHLFFLIKNLDFDETSGRELISDILLKIINKFPLEVVEHYDETLFLTICVRLQNESVDDIILNLKKTINILLERISNPNKKVLYDHSFSWVQDSKISIRKSGFDSLGFFLEIFDLNEKCSEIKVISQQILHETCNEILLFQAKKKEMINAKRKLKNNILWNEYLFKDEENELEKEKMNSKHIELIISLIDFYADAFSSKNREIFEKIFFSKNYQKEDSQNIFESLIILLSHPSEKIILHCLRIIEIIMEKSPNKFKLTYDNKNDIIQLKLMGPLIRLFAKKELLENTEKSLFKTIYFIFEIFYSQQGLNYIELNFILLKKKMLKNLAKISDYNPQISRVLKFISGFLQLHNCENYFNDIILENIFFMHIKLTSVEQHLKLRETEILELNQQILDIVKSKIDSNNFFNIYSRIKTEIEQKKLKRKRVEKENLILNTQSVAEQKQKKNLKKKRSQKRKIMKFKGKLFGKLKQYKL